MEFELLPWLIGVFVVLFVLRVLRSAFGGSPSASRRPSATRAPRERVGGALVRDPQCGTYVPEASAIRIGSGSHTVYFCSTTCRDAYRAASGSVA